MTNDALNWLLLAHTVKFVGPNSAVATPAIAPVLLLKASPAGISGATSQVRTSPPNEVGESDALVTLTVSPSEETE
jgi:hypothetical protein